MTRQPVVYEINTWVWLNELSAQAGKALTLATVPGTVWDELATLGIDYVWFMGVWTRSEQSRRIAVAHPGVRKEFDAVLPDLVPDDVVGSAYAIQRYVVDQHLGGDAGLATARAALRERGIGLILDVVPNHVALDHPWVTDAPECFISKTDPTTPVPPGYFNTSQGHIAHGRDPYFPPWSDTAQLNAYAEAYRERAAGLVTRMAGQCDGVRCDMAMLLLNDVFGWTWSGAAGPAPEREFWTEVIDSVKALYPDFLFLAEAYWDMEHRLLELGFDWAYDKTFYDRLVRGDSGGIRKHVEGTFSTHGRLAKFTENHDEPRAAQTFERSLRCANIVSALMPGVWLLHEGQFDGRRIRCPVQLGRRPVEAADRHLAGFHRRLLKVRQSPAFRQGHFQSLRCRGWPDNPSHEHLLAWLREAEGERFVVVANLSEGPSQGRISLPWPDLVGRECRLRDDLFDVSYQRHGDELRAPGLFVDLPPWGCHVFRLEFD